MSAKQARAAALAKLRAGGKRDWQAQEAVKIYDEVDEDDYRNVVKGRLLEDDFVEEDGIATGYADQGLDDWDRSSTDDDEQEARQARKRVKKEAKEAAAAKAKAPSKKKKGPIITPGANPYINPQRVGEIKAGAPLPEQEDDFMSGLLDGLEGKATVARTEAFKPIEVAPKPRYSGASFASKKSMITPRTSLTTSSSEDAFSSDATLVETAPSSDELKPALHDEDMGGMQMEDFDFMDTSMDVDLSVAVPDTAKDGASDDEDDLFVKPEAPKPKPSFGKRQLVNAVSAKPYVPTLAPAPAPESMALDLPQLPAMVAEPPKAKGMDWRTATAGLAVASMPMVTSAEVEEDAEDELPTPESLMRKKKVATAAPVVASVEALEADGSLRFWWFDFVEPGNGLLILIGKVKVNAGKDEGKWVSACVLVKGIQRKLYVLPRAKALDSDGNEIDDDDDPPEFDDVEMDFHTDATDRYGAQNVVITPGWVRRKYAFGVKGVPREETDWLEATCDFPSGAKAQGDIPHDASGERYSHVFGTQATPFELFVVERKIMGPCWLNIKQSVKSSGISWTKFEAECHKDDVSVFSQDDPNTPKVIPPLTIMSISTRTVVHLTENKREVVCASARVWHDANIDDVLPLEQQPSSVTTLIRPLFTPFPNGFEAAARAQKPAGAKAPTLLPLKDETALLTQLLAIIFRTDPDVIVGTDFAALELDVLLNRLKDLKVDHWSRIGRLRRPKWPKLQATRNAALITGRLICDLSSDGSKSIIDSTTWSLTEMCQTHLKVDREDMDPEDTPKMFDNVHSTAGKLLHFAGHCEADCYFQMAIAFKVQALPLTRQLTNLAGNSWNKTLMGNRAERNDFILLHRFTERGYVCPDKISMWEKKAQKENDAKKARAKAKEAGEEEIKVVASKAKYAGGLVFEPKKGLWDRFVLVMDFNSLYPSIIQEYDIDFSTIDWTADDAEDLEKMPDRSPCEGDPVGVLPQLISSLVERRRMVKRLMKERGVTPARMLQYDITQKALKLTANSMYGCLGFEGSRFYARPLAALTTFKGREILMRTKADAETLSLDVIYGDTDSVMINTDRTELEEARQIGEDFKKLINDKYKKLEIDTDAVFACMLLLAKKKYAALKVEDDGTRTMEVKGLDMKRREYCELSKNASHYVLNQIMSGKPTEDVVDEIHKYLTSLGENVRSGRVALEQFIIFKRLGKNPQDYPDAKSQPHVSVALKMKAKGQSAKAHDVIPYIFCVPESGIPQTSAKAANAYHPDDVRRAGSTLKIDFEVYLTNQVLPPIERLCDPIEGTEKARLAECLGLDVTRYKSVGEQPEREFRTLQSKVSDAERFALAEPFKVRCRVCSSEALFDGLDNTAKLLSLQGMFCANSDCAQPLSLASVAVQLDLQIRMAIGKFYEGWLVCDDASCGHRTRMMSVYGKRCLADGCRGQMHLEYSDSRLYNQLLFFDSLFDSERALTKASGTAQQEGMQTLADANKATLAMLRAVVQKHLDRNGRRWVGMASLFSFMK